MKIKTADMLWGTGLTFLIAVLFFLPIRAWDTVHGKFYDLSLKIRGALKPPPEIAIVAIDDSSMNQVGRWPWPRSKMAELITKIAEGGAKIIAVDVIFLPLPGPEASREDQILGEATRKAGNVIYPFYFTLGKPEGGKKVEAPAHIIPFSLVLFDDPQKFSDFPPLTAKEIFAPVLEVVQGAKALGHINVLPDPDGKVRWDPLLIEFAGHYYPSFSLQIAAAYLGLSRGDIAVRVGQSIRLGKTILPTNPQGMMLINYYGGHQTVPHYSAADVLVGRVNMEVLKDKIVIVGVTAAGTAAGVQDLMATPFSPKFPGVEKHGQEVASIIQNKLISRPLWLSFAELILVVVGGAFLSIILPRSSPFIALLICGFIILILGGIMVGAIFQGIWVRIFFPLLLTGAQYLLYTGLRGKVREKWAEVKGEEQIPTPVVEDFSEAPGLPKKIGRYEILGELGKGAMGVVYKGRDPIIGRLVAIKTIRFDRLYEAQEIEGLKERFFIEAQAAGKLIHPHIVTIFDVGEDRGLSFMAMEFVEGEPLSKFTNKERLLPLEKTIKLISESAEALDFAHRQGIVHRDIKPANIMLTPNGQAKVMDFGIAKLPTSTLTQTGSILGTPAYMSPEQISGRDLDGRSDLFSLGCVFYELLTGTRPFKGENLSALSYQITQGTPLLPSELNQQIPSILDVFIFKALAKSPQQRFQNGQEMANSLREILRNEFG
ncbi:MAG: CHASE2 domain-containing serine/threonine-protein kinase [Thermodesulfobacteriota bacterium]